MTKRVITGHSLVTDLTTIVRAGLALPDAQYFCTETAARWLWPEWPAHDLEFCALKLTRMGAWRSTLGKLKPADFENLSKDELSRRCGGDAEAPIWLYEVMAPQILQEGLGRIFGLAMDVLPILAIIGGTGMTVDRTALKDTTKETELWLQKTKTGLQRQLKIDNLNSHEQVSRALFAPPWSATPLRETTKGHSVDRTSLLWARRESHSEALTAVLDNLLEYSIQDKLFSTYYRPWLEKTETGKIHSFYGLGRTSTGRLGSWSVNLQNVPKRVRKLIVPSEGFDEILVCDYKMLELCVAAHVSNDLLMRKWITEGQDLHANTAAEVLGLPKPTTPQEIERFKLEHEDERASGKMTNFAAIFGVGADSLTWKIFHDTGGKVYIDSTNMETYLEAFFTTFSGWKRYIDRLWTQIKLGNIIRSPTGRRWCLEKSHAGWRKGMNYPVQSLASDLTIMAIRRIYRRLQELRMKSRMIGTVHDNAVFETTKREKPRLISLIHEVFEHPDTRAFGFELSVPLLVDIKSGPNWAATS